MDLRLHQAFLPHLDPDASLAFYRDALGWELRQEVGSGPMRWLTLGPVTQPQTSVVLGPPVTSAGVTDDEHRAILALMAKGAHARISLSTTDLVGAFARLESSNAVEVLQEPIKRPFEGYDCAFLDPAGTVVRIVESPGATT